MRDFGTSVEVYFITPGRCVSNIDGSVKKPDRASLDMNHLFRGALLIVISLMLMGIALPLMAQPTAADAVSLQKKASEAQARIHANKPDRDQLMIAVKTNEVPLAKEVLLRNGFTAEDLENAKITLRTGGGKGAENEIEIAATCCNPKEITIARSLDYFTK